jgi:two-component system response regulator GlrR
MSDDWSDDARTADVDLPRHELRSVRQLHLAWTDETGPHAVATTGERVSIGSAPTNDVVVADPTASKFHCELRIEPSRVRILDLASRNGTRVDGVWVADASLAEGSVLRVGSTSIAVTSSGGHSVVKMSESVRFGDVVGRSRAMRTVFASLERAARSDATVLLEGETGTGKEGLAEALHQASSRRDRPFVVIDCASIPDTLIESELFGHERGAFTGAAARRIGAIESAQGGTVFLDEIGELPMEMQPKLLRVLESRTLRRIGGSERIDVDIRVVAATHRRLRREVSEGRFRQDLFYRIAVLNIEIPPLREHLEDLPEIVDALATRLGANDVQRARLLSTRSLERLASRDWAGNVRELRNELERAMVLDVTETQEQAGAPGPLPFGVARRLAAAAFERSYLLRLLEDNDGVVAQAARVAGLDRVHFYRLLRKHGIRPGSDA